MRRVCRVADVGRIEKVRGPEKAGRGSDSNAKHLPEGHGENGPGGIESARALIVGLGASAGGLEALNAFFQAMPPQSGMAFVVVQHLAPDLKSHLVDILSRDTTMPVVEARDGMRVEPNSVYIIPPAKMMTISNGRLVISEASTGHLNLPVDEFFSSLAFDQGSNAVGISLSGTGSDGARGMRCIKEAGGTVFVQDEPKFAGMPGSVLATGTADFILSANAMPAELVRLSREANVGGEWETGLDRRINSEDASLREIYLLIRKKCGIDFSGYKQTTILRRLERRLAIVRANDLRSYLELLSSRPEEFESLVSDLLIGVTRFFRDVELFAVLNQKVIPALFQKAGRTNCIRVWVAGCATGEEAYSLAMLLEEHASRVRGCYDIKIFATDVDKRAIEIASRGIYSESVVADVPMDLLGKYFIPVNGAYRVSKLVRDRIIFAEQNLLKDAPFSHIDLISCRNLLIYLQPPLQQRLIGLFHFALEPGGYLFLGSSETPGDLQNWFEVVDTKARIYFKSWNGSNANVWHVTDALAGQLERSNAAKNVVRRRSEQRLIDNVMQRLVSEHSPTSFIINENHEVLHSFGHPENYVNVPVGAASLNILQMLPHELSTVISAGLFRVSKDSVPITFDRVKYSTGKGPRSVRIVIEPLFEAGISSYLLLISDTVPTLSDVSASEPISAEDASYRFAELRVELQSTKENLQSAVEELEASNEELQAANEEMLASNEELQSSNEELESVNEELYTSNAEFQKKNQELTEANEDIDNFLRNSDIGMLFLDADLRIRRLTPKITLALNILPHDVGRPISDFSHSLILQILHAAQAVLRDGKTLEMALEAAGRTWYLVRALPYKKEGGRSNGIVITLVNVSELKKGDEAFKLEGRASSAVFGALGIGVCVMGESGQAIKVNQRFCELVDCSRDECGEWSKRITDLWQAQHEVSAGEIAGAAAKMERRISLVLKGGREVSLRAQYLEFKDEDGLPLRAVLVQEG